MRRILLAALLLAGPSMQAGAGDRFADDGVQLRLVVEPPRSDGRFRAALLVDLEPGWKTYWLAPGEGGLPPRLIPNDPSAIEDMRLRLPAPRRMQEGGGTSNVYSAPFAIAIEGRRKTGDVGRLVLEATLGICENLCVPVTTELSAVFPGSDTASGGAVAQAFAALPERSTTTHGVTNARITADRATLIVSVHPGAIPANSELFVAGPKGWTFGAPTRGGSEGISADFSLPVLARPRRGPDVPGAVTAVLVRPDGTALAADDLPVAADGG